MPLRSVSLTAAPFIQYDVPTNGGTTIVSPIASVVVINPAGTLLSLTVTLPALAADNKRIRISSSQILTSVTLGAGAATIVGSITALVLGGFCEYIFKLSNTTWYRIG